MLPSWTLPAVSGNAGSWASSLVSFSPGDRLDRPDQEGAHRCPRDRLAGPVRPVRASLHDLGAGEAVDVALVDAAGGVGEGRLFTRGRQLMVGAVDRAREEAGHLRSGDPTRGDVASVGALRDSPVSQAVDGSLVHVALRVGEGRQRRVRWRFLRRRRAGDVDAAGLKVLTGFSRGERNQCERQRGGQDQGGRARLFGDGGEYGESSGHRASLHVRRSTFPSDPRRSSGPESPPPPTRRPPDGFHPANRSIPRSRPSVTAPGAA